MTQVDQLMVAVFLFLTMLGMGATLSLRDFARVLRRPLWLSIGLASQFLWMPLIAFGLASAFGLSPAVAVGFITMGCSSGGTTSNLFSYYSGADLALSISMTVTSTVVAVVAMPLLLALYTAPFTAAAGAAGESLAVPYASVVTTLVAVLVPVACGVALRSWRPGWAARAERIGSLAGIAVLALLVVSSALRDLDRVFQYSAAEVFCAVALGPLGFAFGWVFATLLGVPGLQKRAITLETGIQNAPLAFGVLILSFSSPLVDEALRVPLLYGVLVVPASAAVALWLRRSPA